MFKAIRARMNPTTVLAVLALVFAMTGGAYAAKKYLITSTKQISPSVLRALQGKAGPAGPTGSQGPAGPQGAAGANGKDGVNGTNGKDGANGASVETASFSGVKAPCQAGGVEVKSASPTTLVCNGKEGKEGKQGIQGEPWTAGGTLPEGKSEKGTWSNIFTATAAKQAATQGISFVIPLKAEPEAHFIGVKEELAGQKNENPAIKEGLCKGGPEDPEAKSGNLCVFALNENERATDYLLLGKFPVRVFDPSPFGAIVATESTEAGQVFALGSWVVTG